MLVSVIFFKRIHIFSFASRILLMAVLKIAFSTTVKALVSIGAKSKTKFTNLEKKRVV